MSSTGSGGRLIAAILMAASAFVFSTLHLLTTDHRAVAEDAQFAVYPMAGHGPHHQHPEIVSALVNDFLR